MKTVINSLILSLLFSTLLSASSIVGSWELDLEKSYEMNKKEAYRYLPEIDKDIRYMEFKADDSVTLTSADMKSEVNKYTKVIGKSYVLMTSVEPIKVFSISKKSFRMEQMGISFYYAPKGSVKRVAKVIPKDFPYYEQSYRSVRKIDGMYQYIKLSPKGEIFWNYSSAEKNLDPSKISRKLGSFSEVKGEFLFTNRIDKILLDEKKVHLSMHRQGLVSPYVLASYKDPSITPSASNKLPWSTKEVKAYTQKHDTIKYHKVGTEPGMKGIKNVNIEVSLKVVPFNKEMSSGKFYYPKGTMFELLDDDKTTNNNQKIDRNIDPKSWGASVNEYSAFSPFLIQSNKPKNYKFEIVGEQTVTVPAGTFECVIAYIKGSGNKKVWMIKDKPGVYAKYLDDFYEYTLLEIK